MITKTKYSIPLTVIDKLSFDDFSNMKNSINQPTGNFFYDPWEIKPEFKGTVWEEILNTISDDIGEARIIILESGTCYWSHSDIDDRWHLTLQAKESYLVNLDDNVMHPLKKDGVWYLMDTGKIHSAVNFGNRSRVQLVVRKLLKNNILTDSTRVKIVLNSPNAEYRYIFDHDISPWLNKANKNGYISNFKHNTEEQTVEFDIENNMIPSLQERLGSTFKLEILNGIL